jgi:hypothetical protein
MGYTPRTLFASRGDINGSGRKLEFDHEHADGRAQGDAVADRRRQRAHGNAGREGNSTEIFDGTVNGDSVAWKVSITNPMPLTLDFSGKVSGDSISGDMGIGPMGSFPFTGTRA